LALPNRALICQAKLACVGFHQYDRLGSEIAGHLSDLEEKLSKKVWYDFGLRTNFWRSSGWPRRILNQESLRKMQSSRLCCS